MDIIVFGGDHLGKIPHLLHDHGVEMVRHVSGRKHGDFKIIIPSQTDTILVLTDYLSHSMLSMIKDTAKRRSIKTVFAKRSWAEISKVMNLG